MKAVMLQLSRRPRAGHANGGPARDPGPSRAVGANAPKADRVSALGRNTCAPRGGVAQAPRLRVGPCSGAAGSSWRRATSGIATLVFARGRGSGRLRAGRNGAGRSGARCGDETPQRTRNRILGAGKTAVARRRGRRPPQILAARDSPSRWRGRPRVGSIIAHESFPRQKPNPAERPPPRPPRRPLCGFKR